MFEIDERGVWEIYETDELHGQLLDGERHGLWLEVVGEAITVSLWAHGRRLEEQKVSSVGGSPSGGRSTHAPPDDE